MMQPALASIGSISTAAMSLFSANRRSTSSKSLKRSSVVRSEVGRWLGWNSASLEWTLPKLTSSNQPSKPAAILAILGLLV
ncbi:hypothetical protein D9M68_915180 [compost metagenome]